MERVVVIGAGGFVGRHLMTSLHARGTLAAGVSRRQRPHSVRCADWLALDILEDADLLTEFLATFRPDVVFHLAATSFEPLAATQPWTVLQNNILSTLNVMSACRRLSPVPRCVVVSSSAVYGRQGPNSSPLKETRSLLPLTTYGVSKVAVETLALQHARIGDVPVIVVRPFNLTGPGEHAVFVTSAFARQVALIEAGRQPAVIRVGDLSTTRDFTDVRDAAEGLASAAEFGEPGETYNLCSGTGVRIDDLVRRLLQESPANVDIEFDPTLMRPVEIKAQWGDPRKLRQATGWTPRIALERTLADVLEDWRGRICEPESENDEARG